MENLEKTKLNASICHNSEIFKIRNTDLQFRSPRYSWQKNEKKDAGKLQRIMRLTQMQ